MEFLNLDGLWTYQLSEWDDYEREEVEEMLEGVELIIIKEYTMSPNSDVWSVDYKGHDFTIVNDLVYGCDIRTSDRDDLMMMEKLIKSFKL